MVSELQTHLGSDKILGYIMKLFLLLFFATAGCATTSSVISSIAPDAYQSGDYEKHVAEADKKENLFRANYFKPDVKDKIIKENLAGIKKGELENSDMYALRKAYMELSHALIETGNFERASKVCDEGVKIAITLREARLQYIKSKPTDALAEKIAKSIFNLSIQPEYDNDAFLRRMFLYKAYIVWFTTGDKQQAFKIFEEFLNKVSTDEDKPFLLMDRGYFYDVIQGDYKKSLDQFAEAAELIGKLHVLNTDMRYMYSIQAYGKMADLYVKLGELAKAEKTLGKSEELQTGLLYKVGKIISGFQRTRTAVIKSRIGRTYALLRDFSKSKKYFDEAFGTVSKIDPQTRNYKDLEALSTYYIFYGTYYLGLQGSYKEAAEYVDKGIIYLRPYYLESILEEPNIETAYLYSSELHFLLGEYDKALEFANKAADYSKRNYDKVGNATAHTLLGQIYYKKGEKQNAKQAYEEAIKLTRNDIESTENWKLFYGVGQVYEDLGSREALEYYKKAVDEVEKLWKGRFKDTQKQVSFIDNRLVVFEPIIRILSRQNKSEEAFNYMERSKSRAFFETSLFNEGKDLNESGTDSEPMTGIQAKKMLTTDSALLEYYVGEKSVVGAVVTQKGIYIKELPINTRQLQEDVMSFRYSIENLSSDYKEKGVNLYVELIRPFEKSLSGIESICIIPHGVLHYLPFQALLIKSDSDKGISPELIKKEETLLAMLSRTKNQLNRGISVKENKSQRPLEETKEIEARAQLESVQSQIKAERAQKGITETRPTFLIDKYKIFYAPSSTILSVVHKSGNNRKEKILAIGSPPRVDISDLGLKDDAGNNVTYADKLANAKLEVQQVSSIFTDKAVFTDDAASETAAKSNASNYDVVLFSAHGYLNRREPLKSAILLNKDSANDGRLTVAEIENMSIKTNLVALSACETGLVSGYEGISEAIDDIKFPHGDDLVGLQRGFIKSGASTVLSTLWSVDDESTSAFMVEFFKNYRAGKDKITALQEASRKLMNSQKEWEYPYFWAPFVLSGDWR